MDHTAPSLLTDAALAQRLVALTGEARQALVEFLLHLDEFDRRRAFLQEGYGSLWTWCHGVLHLREGPAARRIAAMRVLRRFPALEAPLRDGRLCLTTVTVLGPMLTDQNLEELVARAAFRTKAETEELVVAMQPRPAPRDGVRRTPAATVRSRLDAPERATGESDTPATPPAGGAQAVEGLLGRGEAGSANVVTTAPPALSIEAIRIAPSVEIQPVARDRWSMRVTLDAVMKADLELLTSLASHAHGRDLAAVLHEAIRCGIEKLGQRRGAVEPSRGMASRAPADGAPGQRIPIPAEVRRQVWRRDGGRCAWRAPDGRRCESRHKLEFDHVVAVARGGASTADNVRLLCRPHNALHADETFGREHMAQFRATQLALR